MTASCIAAPFRKNLGIWGNFASMAITVLQYSYSTLLIIAYTSVVAFTLCMTILYRQRIGYPIMGIFLFFLLDALVIDLTEFVPVFSEWYNRLFLQTPSIKTVIYLGIAFCSMAFYTTQKGGTVGPFHVMIVALLGLWYIFIPLTGMNATSVYLYYIAYQIFAIFACIYALRDIPRIEGVPFGRRGFLRLIMWVTIAFSLCVIAEDTYVIFRVDSYTQGNIHIYDRNRCEDLMRLTYVGIFYAYVLRIFHAGEINPADFLFGGRVAAADPAAAEAPAAAVTAGGAGSAAPAPAPETDVEYKRMKFARQLGLTERELEVFTLLLAGQNNQEISSRLTVSMGTVKAHVHNIYQKADVTRRYELVRMYEAFEPK